MLYIRVVESKLKLNCRAFALMVYFVGFMEIYSEDSNIIHIRYEINKFSLGSYLLFRLRVLIRTCDDGFMLRYEN